MGLYYVASGPMPTTAAQAVVAAVAATIKTILQIKLGASTNQIGKVVAWGVSFDGAAAATPAKCELLSTKAIGATITEFVAADIINHGDPNASAVTDDFPFAFTAAGDESGYNATAEGTIVATRMFDVQFVAPTNQYGWEYSLGREPAFNNSEFIRIRVTAPANVNVYAWMKIEV